MDAVSRLGQLIDASLDKCRAGEFASLALALKPVLPEVITALQAIMFDPEATITQKQKALETILVLAPLHKRDEER